MKRIILNNWTDEVGNSIELNSINLEKKLENQQDKINNSLYRSEEITYKAPTLVSYNPNRFRP